MLLCLIYFDGAEIKDTTTTSTTANPRPPPIASVAAQVFSAVFAIFKIQFYLFILVGRLAES